MSHRKIVLDMAVLPVMTISVFAPATAAPRSPAVPGPGDVVIHLPFASRSVTATSSHHIWLGIGWAASTDSRVHQAGGAIQISPVLHGAAIRIPAARRYWGPITSSTPGPGATCPSDTGQQAFWCYDLGTLPVGTHALSAVLSVRHMLTEGCSTNGTPDVYSGVFGADTVTISVGP